MADEVDAQKIPALPLRPIGCGYNRGDRVQGWVRGIRLASNYDGQAVLIEGKDVTDLYSIALGKEIGRYRNDESGALAIKMIASLGDE
jgi:hypothetical protein